MKPSLLFAAAAVYVAVLVAVCALVPMSDSACILTWLAGSAGLGMAFAVKDQSLKKTTALPNGAASTNSAGFDLGHGSRGDFVADCELKISAPALTTAEQPDAKTLKYSVQHDDAADFGTVATLYPDLITQTGAGGAGAAAAEVIVRLPVDVKRYVRVRATGSATGDSSAKSFTSELLF